MYCLLIHLTSNDPRTVQVFLSKRPLQIGFRATTNNNISTYNNTNLHNIHDFLKAQEEELVAAVGLSDEEIGVPVGAAKGIACTNRFGDDVGDAIATHWRQELEGLGLDWSQTGNQGGAAQTGREDRHKGRAHRIFS